MKTSSVFELLMLSEKSKMILLNCGTLADGHTWKPFSQEGDSIPSIPEAFFEREQLMRDEDQFNVETSCKDLPCFDKVGYPKGSFALPIETQGIALLTWS